MKMLFLRFGIALFATAVLSLSVFAQNRAETFAITNARIVTVSGAPIERGTIILRGGLIESVGANVRVPADARVIDGAGLTVYPGFFDAYTNLGLAPAALTLPRPATPGVVQIQQAQQAAQPQSNSNYPNGLQPEKSVVEQLRAGEAQFETARSNGFTTALTVGREGIFNGQSALINLAGDSVSAMIVRAPVAEHVTFRTLGNVYPQSLLGTFSAMRQMFFDAQRFDQMKKMYDANPRGIRRPEADASLEALLPVINGTMPIVFNANTEREIVRVLDLAQQFNLKAIISGGQEAWKQSARLKRQNVPVLLSLNFPKRTAVASPEADAETVEILRLRAETPKGAARLAQAGVKFAFQSGALTNLSDFLANANKATENGLTREAALRAMTLSAAEIFDVGNRLGSIETGKIANLVVSRGDVFAKDKTITHVFVDGKLFEQKDKPKMPPTPPGTTAPTTRGLQAVGGTWSINVELPGQPIPGTLSFVQQDKTLTGSLQTQFGTSQITDGEVTADGFRFTATIDFAGNTRELVVNGRVNGNQISGTFTTSEGAIPFSGTRNP
ncbi:MAG: amidohydrolase family protein [Acidobacteriota bacterium]|nr:amidohydrolase family protein [Acidobacteriota bacterium]